MLTSRVPSMSPTWPLGWNNSPLESSRRKAIVIPDYQEPAGTLTFAETLHLGTWKLYWLFQQLLCRLNCSELNDNLACRTWIGSEKLRWWGQVGKSQDGWNWVRKLGIGAHGSGANQTWNITIHLEIVPRNHWWCSIFVTYILFIQLCFSLCSLFSPLYYYRWVPSAPPVTRRPGTRVGG